MALTGARSLPVTHEVMVCWGAGKHEQGLANSVCNCLYFSLQFNSYWRTIPTLQYTRHSFHVCDLMFHKFLNVSSVGQSCISNGRASDRHRRRVEVT